MSVAFSYYVGCLHAECHYAECRYAECRGAFMNILAYLAAAVSYDSKLFRF